MSLHQERVVYSLASWDRYDINNLRTMALQNIGVPIRFDYVDVNGEPTDIRYTFVPTIEIRQLIQTFEASVASARILQFAEFISSRQYQTILDFIASNKNLSPEEQKVTIQCLLAACIRASSNYKTYGIYRQYSDPQQLVPISSSNLVELITQTYREKLNGFPRLKEVVANPPKFKDGEFKLLDAIG